MIGHTCYENGVTTNHSAEITQFTVCFTQFTLYWNHCRRYKNN